MNWVSDGVKICLQKSVVFWLSFHFIINSCAHAMFVSVNVTSHKMTDQAVPDELNITLITDLGTRAHLCLKRVDHTGPNVPVYTHNVGPDGRHVHTREQLQDKQNVGYYQDASNEAVIQVTRTNPLGEKEVRLVLKGQLNMAGSRYTLSLGTRRKRNVQKEMPSSSGEAYNLFPQTPTQFAQHDYIEAPPETKLRFVEVTQLQIPRLSFAGPSSHIPQLSFAGPSPHIPQLTTRMLEPTASSQRRRRQSQTAENYYVDVAAMADYATYKRFLSSSETKADTLQAMREYYAFIFTGVDLRYQSITSTNYVIHVRLIKVIVTETAAASTFTEKFRVTSKPWDEVDAQSVLSAFSDFSAGAGTDMLNPCDHAMLFTGYDLTSTLANSVNTNATTGLAFTSTLCRTDGKSVSVVEDLGGFQAVDTAAHELGHSLSARHDGDGNSCQSTDRYIMASGSSQVTSSNLFHPWLFSPCSIASFTNFLSSSLRTTRGQACLMSSLPVDSGVPDVSSRLPGQEFPPDDQCRMIYGSASRLCRGTEFGTSSSVCTSMFCFDPGTAGTCYEQTAAMGTTCGNGKICLNGQCVYDSRAPAVDGRCNQPQVDLLDKYDCVFGDQPGNAFDELLCPDFVAGFSGYCYQAIVRGRCCASCKKAYRTVTECEYGDKVRGCTANVCSFAAVSYSEQCCGTCNYGSHFTVPTSTPTTLNATINARYPPERQPTTLATILTSALHIAGCHQPRPQVELLYHGVCVDNPEMLVNGHACADAVASSPRLCYQPDVSAACCSSCDEVNTGVAGTDSQGQEEDDDNNINKEQVEVEEETKDGDDEQNEDDEKQSQNDQQEEEEAEREDGRTGKDEKEHEESEGMGNDKRREGEDAAKDRNAEEIMAKTDIVLSIHVNLGCEYGDQDPSSCGQAKSCERNTTGCCRTCSTTVGSRNGSVTAPSMSASASSCTDQHNAQINNLACAAAIAQSPFYCYTATVLETCCFSCQQRHSGVKDCEYGDRTPQKCQSISRTAECGRVGHDCCSTCVSHAHRSITSALVLFAIVPFIRLLISVLVVN